MKVLGFTGPAGSGKDYVAARVRDLFPGSVRVAIADELRRELEEVLAVPAGSSAVWAKPYSEPVRWILQRYGTEFRRAQNPDYWVSRAERTIVGSDADVVTVTDVRFSNEAEMIHRVGGIVVLVRCLDAVRLERLAGVEPPPHVSEQSLAADAEVFNSEVTVASGELLDYLGLVHGCYRCLLLEAHAWHDDGAAWPVHAALFPPPPGHSETPVSHMWHDDGTAA